METIDADPRGGWRIEIRKTLFDEAELVFLTGDRVAVEDAHPHLFEALPSNVEERARRRVGLSRLTGCAVRLGHGIFRHSQ